MGLPRASSSTSLSSQRIFCISGSSIASTRTPQTTPVIFWALGLICGASEKKVSRLASLSIWAFRPFSS